MSTIKETAAKRSRAKFKLVTTSARVPSEKVHFEPQRIIDIPYTIGLLCQRLEWSEQHLCGIFSQKGVYITEDSILTPEDISKLRPMIEARCKAISRKLKTETNQKNGRCLKSKDKVMTGIESVYDKLPFYGPGRLIYIRSR